MRQLTDSEREAMQTPLREYWVQRDGLLPSETRSFEAGFIAALDHLAAQIRALTAERDALRAALKPFAKVGELIKPFQHIAATDTYLWKQDSTTPTGQFGITLADCIEARRVLGEER